MSAVDYVEQWVRTCSEMEDCPVLLYKHEAVEDKSNEFMLVIMTEFQRHILITSAKQVVCIDSFSHFKDGRFYFTLLTVIDEQDVAFPVAVCLSRKMNKFILVQFFSSIEKSTGPLSCSYFMSIMDKYFYEAWQEVMQDNSTWVWSIWSFEDKIRNHMNKLIKDMPTREATYRLFRTIMECYSRPVFTTMLKNFFNSLKDDKLSEKFGMYFETHFGSNAEKWACCYRKDLKLSTDIYLEFLHKTLTYWFRRCNNKRIDKFLMTFMKWLRCKMLDRLSNTMDEEKIKLAETNISAYHSMGLELECENIVSLSDKIWLIQSKEEADSYVTREYESCPDLCDLRCIDCDVCVHMFSCSCVHSLIHANMCQHIHAVVWKFLTPHLSPPASPVQDDFSNAFNFPKESELIPDESADMLENVFKRMQEVYKQLRMNKCKLNKSSLSEVMGMLNKCYKICSDGEVIYNLSSTSTQTEAVSVLSTNHSFSSFSNITSKPILENHENSTLIPEANPFNANSNSTKNHENGHFIPRIAPAFDNISNFAYEKIGNLRFIPMLSNNVSEKCGKINLIPIEPSDSISEPEHASKKHCVRNTNLPIFPLSKDSSNISFVPTTNTPLIRPSETTSLSLHACSNPVHSDSHSKMNSVLQGTCSNLTNAQAMLESLPVERPYLIKCNAPIIRTSKHRIKTCFPNVKGIDEKIDSGKSSIVQTRSFHLTPNNQSEGPHFFWDSVSKKYFAMKDKGSLTAELNQLPESGLNPSSKAPSVSFSDEHYESDAKDSASHDSSVSSSDEDFEKDSTFVKNSISNGPKHSVPNDNEPSTADSNESFEIEMNLASEEPSVSSSDEHFEIDTPFLKNSVAQDPKYFVMKDKVLSNPESNEIELNPSLKAPSVSFSDEHESEAKDSAPHNHLVPKPSISSALSSNHHGPVSHNPIVIRASIASVSSSNNETSSFSHNPIVVKATAASMSSS